MRLENLPKQEYELINVRMQTVETGTPLTCNHCGSTIFNIATIKGKIDNKTYNVGLDCLKNLLNKTIYFDTNTMLHFECAQIEWHKAKCTLNRMNKNAGAYDFKLFIIEEKGYFFFEYFFKKDIGEFKKGESGGRTCFLKLNTLPFFRNTQTTFKL